MVCDISKAIETSSTSVFSLESSGPARRHLAATQAGQAFRAEIPKQSHFEIALD
jgi:hypothetical protein